MERTVLKIEHFTENAPEDISVLSGMDVDARKRSANESDSDIRRFGLLSETSGSRQTVKLPALEV